MNETSDLRASTILVAEDDMEDCMLLGEAQREAGYHHDLRFVRDGEELFEYLHGRGRYADRAAAPYPDLILLDLKMPKTDGREVLRELRSAPRLQRIPVVVLTTSSVPEDIGLCYDLGANSYITKPVTFRALVDMITILSKYWFGLVELPVRS